MAKGASAAPGDRTSASSRAIEARARSQLSRKGGIRLSSNDREDTTIYKVVVNHEEQSSIWPEYKENALGGSDAGKVGTKAECLAYIKEVWTDMRPLNLRKKMEEVAKS